MAERSEMIKIRVTPEEKQQIKDYLEETGEFDGMSRFFRVLAHERMNTDDDTTSIDPEEIIDAMEVALSDVTEHLTRLDDRLADVEQKVSNEDEIDKLARELYDEIPVVESEDEMRDLKAVQRLEPEEEMRILSTPEAWGEFFGVEVEEVRRALSRAQEYYPDLKFYRTREGPRRYYIERPNFNANREEGGE